MIGKEDLADSGIVFGMGFEPFRGGPMQYPKSRGEADVVKTLKRLTKNTVNDFCLAKDGPHEFLSQ